TYPWADLGGTPDNDLFAHYQTLASVRDENIALTDGDIRVLLADDASDLVAYGRRTDNQAAVIVINRSEQNRTVTIPVAGYLSNGTVLQNKYDVGVEGPASVSVAGEAIGGSIGPKSAWILVTDLIDLQPPAAPDNL